MFWRLSPLLGLVCVASACRTGSSSPNPAPTPSAATAPVVAAQRFGAAIGTSAKPEPIAAVLSSPERFAGRPLLVEGYVRRACSRRGCWMELAEGVDPKLPGCRVTFKDYGFFVPTDSAGSSAKVEAQLELATLSPASVDHMEREGATFRDKTRDGSAREVRLIATGVELRR